mgnify:CR=1 FL=1
MSPYRDTNEQDAEPFLDSDTLTAYWVAERFDKTNLTAPGYPELELPKVKAFMKKYLANLSKDYCLELCAGDGRWVKEWLGEVFAVVDVHDGVR